MSLNTSKIILKIFGIVSIIFGILGIIAGIIAIVGSTIIGTSVATGDIAASTEIAAQIALLGFGGLFIIIGSVIKLLSGIFSVRATKDISKIMPAWIFALIGTLTSLVSVVSVFYQKTQALNISNSIVAIVGLLISILIFVAANKIKSSAKK